MKKSFQSLILVMILFSSFSSTHPQENKASTKTKIQNIVDTIKKNARPLLTFAIPAAATFAYFYRQSAEQTIKNTKELVNSYNGSGLLWQLWGTYSPICNLNNAHLLLRNPKNVNSFLYFEATFWAFFAGQISSALYATIKSHEERGEKFLSQIKQENL